MPVNLSPHSSWADVYDLAYKRSFGEFYNQLTEATIQVISDRISSSGRIVDYGAGTGRLSIPLAQKGFDVTAVDPCEEMLNQLKQKKRNGMMLNAVCSKMQDYKGHMEFDIALCVFTVLLYLLDEETLRKSLVAAHASLKPSGMLLIDIPSRAIFQSYSRKDHLIDRTVSVIREQGDVFFYREDLKMRQSNGDESSYSDLFRIRYWPTETVSKVLEEAGFFLDADLSNYFSGTGSHYWLMKKAE